MENSEQKYFQNSNRDSAVSRIGDNGNQRTHVNNANDISPWMRVSTKVAFVISKAQSTVVPNKLEIKMKLKWIFVQGVMRSTPWALGQLIWPVGRSDPSRCDTLQHRMCDTCVGLYVLSPKLRH